MQWVFICSPRADRTLPQPSPTLSPTTPRSVGSGQATSLGPCLSLVLAMGSMAQAYQGLETEPQLWLPMHHPPLSIPAGHIHTARSAARAFPWDPLAPPSHVPAFPRGARP